jgi:hypothetical protein
MFRLLFGHYQAYHFVLRCWAFCLRLYVYILILNDTQQDAAHKGFSLRWINRWVAPWARHWGSCPVWGVCYLCLILIKIEEDQKNITVRSQYQPFSSSGLVKCGQTDRYRHGEDNTRIFAAVHCERPKGCCFSCWQFFLAFHLQRDIVFEMNLESRNVGYERPARRQAPRS